MCLTGTRPCAYKTLTKDAERFAAGRSEKDRSPFAAVGPGASLNDTERPRRDEPPGPSEQGPGSAHGDGRAEMALHQKTQRTPQQAARHYAKPSRMARLGKRWDARVKAMQDDLMARAAAAALAAEKAA